MQKAIMDVEDFDKLTKFITSRQVGMLEVERATEVLNILKRVKIAEVQEESKTKTK
jgi:hypothetical protein